MSLVIFPPIDDRRLRELTSVAGDLPLRNCLNADEAAEEITYATAFYGKITPSLLQRAERLQWVQAPTASLEHYLFPELITHPCRLTNMRGLFSDVVADHVMGYVLCFARQLTTYIRQQRERRWEPVGGEAARSGFDTGPGQVNAIDRAHRHLSDLTLGVVGAGAIGREVLIRARAFGMTVLGIDPVVRCVPGVLEDVWPVESLPRLLAAAEVVVIAAPHTPRTERMFRMQQFKQMRRDAVLINVGRGIIVDLHDLTTALESGVIAGAALDVFEIEPLPTDHPLWEMDQVIITPHVAAASPRVAERHLQTLKENVRRFSTGLPLLNVVDKSAWF